MRKLNCVIRLRRVEAVPPFQFFRAAWRVWVRFVFPASEIGVVTTLKCCCPLHVNPPFVE